MTFYEAALEVLREEGRPLHYKKITEHAVKRNLLSHVGRTPENTMDSRLTQETQKTDNGSLIRIVRPGVFALIDGADVEKARQTIRLLDPDATEPEEQEPTSTAKELVDQQNTPNESSTESSPSTAKSPELPRREALANMPDKPTREETDVGDIADHIAELLSSNGSLTLIELSEKLETTAWSSVGEFSPVVLRRILAHANEIRGSAGDPPLFAELESDRWILTETSDQGLAESYESLRTWQSRHEHLLLHRLGDQLSNMSSGKIQFTVGLIMERLGYQGITVGKTVDSEISNLVGTIQRGLFNEQVVVRIVKRGQQASDKSIISLRGSLNLYKADRGIIISIDGADNTTDKLKRDDNVAPVSILTRNDLAKLMLETGVGIQHYQVSTAYLDDAFFA